MWLKTYVIEKERKLEERKRRDEEKEAPLPSSGY